MGNINFTKMSTTSKEAAQPKKQFESVETFKFHEIFADETNNGLYFNEVYFPEEVVLMILSYLDPKELLRASQVCKKWCNIVKSDSFWAGIYHRKYNKKPKKLPWYVYYSFFSTQYFDKNLIKNGNGQDEYKHWTIIVNYGDQFRIEDPPCGADPLPLDIPEFNGKTSCFATSYYECNKLQEINLENSRLMQLILNRYKPHIYLSEWVAGRFDCGCVYNLWCKLFGIKCDKKEPKKKKSENSEDERETERSWRENSDYSESDYDEDEEEEPLHVGHVDFRVEQWAGSTWSKVELLVKDYPPGVKKIVFQHEGKDTQFWKGHYGSKMAGGVMKILFDSIEPL